MESQDIDIDVFVKKLSIELRKFKTLADLHKQIVNAPFKYRIESTFLYLGIMVLLLENKETGSMDRIALSDTELARNTTKVSKVKFSDINISLSYKDNLIIRAIDEQKPQKTDDWKDLFSPVLSKDHARINQASGGIASSFVYPLMLDKSKGVLIFSYYQYLNEISDLQDTFMKKYSQIVSSLLN